jgi:DNA-binding MarR family transcriptional regulator
MREAVAAESPGPGVGEVAQAMAELQLAADAVDAAAADQFGVNRTDLALLGLLDSRGALSAGELASGLRLTPPSTTVAIQRLVEAGYVVRTTDPADRRRAIVDLTDQAREASRGVYGPLGTEGARELERYTGDELRTIHDFLVRSSDLQRRHAGRIRASQPSTQRRRGTSRSGGATEADPTA